MKIGQFYAKFKALRPKLKKYFWLWVIYQAVKGIITTALIWVPLLYTILNKTGS